MRFSLKSVAFVLMAVGVCAASPSAGAFTRTSSASSQTFVTPRGEAQNVRFEQRENGAVHIFYDLTSSDPRGVYSVRLEASQDSGATFGIRPQTVTGDAGDGVRPGPGKRIVWDSGKDVERVQIDRFRFRVIATGGPLQVEPSPPAGPAIAASVIEVETTPTGAAITVDGALRGLSPLKLRDLSPGVHTFTITKSGYEGASRTLVVVPGKDDRIQVELPVQPMTPPPSASSIAAPKGGGKGKWIAIIGGVAAAGAVAAASGGGGTKPPPPPPPPIQCSFSLDPNPRTFSRGGGVLPITVNVSPSGCSNPSWTVSSTTPAFWVSLTPASGSGTGGVSVTATTNTGAQREARVTIAGIEATIRQDSGATVCTLGGSFGSDGDPVNSTRTSVPGDCAGCGARRFTVTATDAACLNDLTVEGMPVWMSASLSPPSSGTRVLNFLVAQRNLTGAARSVNLGLRTLATTTNGPTITISQCAGGCR